MMDYAGGEPHREELKVTVAKPALVTFEDAYGTVTLVAGTQKLFYALFLVTQRSDDLALHPQS